MTKMNHAKPFRHVKMSYSHGATLTDFYNNIVCYFTLFKSKRLTEKCSFFSCKSICKPCHTCSAKLILSCKKSLLERKPLWQTLVHGRLQAVQPILTALWSGDVFIVIIFLKPWLGWGTCERSSSLIFHTSVFFFCCCLLLFCVFISHSLCVTHVQGGGGKIRVQNTSLHPGSGKDHFIVWPVDFIPFMFN